MLSLNTVLVLFLFTVIGLGMRSVDFCDEIKRRKIINVNYNKI